LPGEEPDELERLRQAYETSLSWQLTRPVRAVGRLARALGSQKPSDDPSVPRAQNRVDSWLDQFYGEHLKAIDAACAEGPSDQRYALFRDLDDDAWALLLTQQYQLYPHIRALLPSMPEPELQEMWNGASGLLLARQSSSFYTKLRASYERHGERPLTDASVLDFGCGWGRLTRYLSRDVAPGRLYGCDPVEGILAICRANRVPATFAASAFVPERVPFDERFDLAFAFSVFTHLSEPAHEQSLVALHRSLRPGGILIVTIRPPEYLWHCEAMRPLLDELGPDTQAALALPRYLFVPHPADPRHPQAGGERQIEYGETVITMPYVRERWSARFELLETQVQLDDLHQVILTLRRK
jgi:SAM-dependent methyltransferase